MQERRHSNTSSPTNSVISVLNTYYGRGNSTSIGAYKGSSLHGSALPYVSDLVSNFPSKVKSSSQVPDAVAVYREVGRGRERAVWGVVVSPSRSSSPPCAA